MYIWNNSFILSTWKQLFLTCAKSPHSKRKWRTVNGASQPTHCGCSSPCSKYEWVTLVWPKRSRAKTTSSLLMFRTTDWYSPIVGLMSRSLLPMLLFHEVCHSSKIYLLIDGLKLENRILKEVGSNESDVFACLSTISFPWIPIWLGIQQRAIFEVWCCLAMVLLLDFDHLNSIVCLNCILGLYNEYHRWFM